MYVHKGVFVCVEVGVVSRSGSNEVLHKQVEEMRQRLAVSEKEAKKHGEKGGEWDKGSYREIVAAVYFFNLKVYFEYITKTTLWLLLLLFSTSLLACTFAFSKKKKKKVKSSML